MPFTYQRKTSDLYSENFQKKKRSGVLLLNFCKNGEFVWTSVFLHQERRIINDKVTRHGHNGSQVGKTAQKLGFIHIVYNAYAFACLTTNGK